MVATASILEKLSRFLISHHVGHVSYLFDNLGKTHHIDTTHYTGHRTLPFILSRTTLSSLPATFVATQVYSPLSTALVFNISSLLDDTH